MKIFLALALLLSITISSFAKNRDTLHVQPKDIDLKHLQTGDFGYILYHKKTKDGPALRITLVKMNVESQVYHGKSAFVIKQQWDYDTVMHTSYSVFDAKDFSTILHDTYWKQLGYSMKFDFETKKVEFKNVSYKGEIPDSIKTSVIKDFNQSFDKYNLNWHEDLIVYTILPYKENRTFAINYYDPGFGKAEEVMYSVTGSDTLVGRSGEKVDCWVLNHYTDDKFPEKGYERFWIAKKTNEVLKEEDFGGPAYGYRYKLKLGISGER
jgi:hypothetical protein